MAVKLNAVLGPIVLGKVVSRLRTQKLVDSDVLEANVLTIKLSRRLLIFDKTTNTKFLTDTVADVSFLPKPAGQRCEVRTLNLFAANDTLISTYGSFRCVHLISLHCLIK